ncbi:Ig-like domain-containing protein [Cellulomonas sp. 179-A 4D5 NHS]|uniref:Ig-like domain-containing protein n=1 Tax=Cellulomonas sp. 179-A 4D5 NHS TaxID=3142378 RepID=UPI0039A2E0E9
MVALSLVLAPLTLLGAASPAQAAPIRNFTPAFSANTNGEILVAANTLMTCSTTSGAPGAGTCAAGRAATSGNYSNNDYRMQFVDVDGNAATFNSSTADLQVPPGGSVLFAALVWGGRTRGTTAVGNNGALRGQAMFTVPGGTPTPVTAPAGQVDVAPTDGWGTAYQSWVDVTDTVAAAGSGTYILGNVQSAFNTDNSYAGWSLVVALADPSAPARNLTIFTGLASVASGDPLPRFTVSGFLTPPSGPVRTTVGAVTYEGDMGLTGDTFQLNTTTITDALNPDNNPFNSTVSSHGAQVATRNPAYRNQFGYDADLFSANGVLPNNATSASLSLTTGGEQYFPGVVTFSTELYDPKLLGTKTVVDDNGGQVVAGDTLTYTVPVENIGLDTASQSRFFDAIPTGTTFVPGSITIDGNSRTDIAGDDFAEYVAPGPLGQGYILAYLGAGATPSEGGAIPMSAGSAQHLVTFKVQVDAGTTNGQQLINAAALTYRGQTTRASSSSATNAVVSPVIAAPTAGNNPPVASPHILSFTPAAGARTLNIPVLAGDSDPDGDTLTVVGVTNAAGGELTINPDGTVTYAPRDDFAGRDVFTYTIQDTAGNRATAVVQVEVVNTAPDAVDDTATVPASTTTAVAVLPNDTDPNGDTLAVRSVSSASTQGGTVALVGGEVRYTPAPGFRGTDTFTYVVEDSRGGSDTATVTLTVVNNPPVANPDTYATAAGSSVNLTVRSNDTDPDGDTFTVARVSGPANGTLVLNADGTGTYTANAGFSGVDSFTYTATDSLGATSAPTTVQITVNGAPVAVDDTASTPTNTAVGIDVLGDDTDPNGDTLSVASFTPPVNGSVVPLPSGQLQYTPATGFAGTDTFDYTVTDGALTDTATVTVTVANADPVANPDATGTLPDTPATNIDVLANDTDPNIPSTTQLLQVTGASATNGASVVVNNGATLTVTPAAGFAGDITVTYTLSDGAGGTATGILTVSVDNATPVAAPDGPVDTPTDTPVRIDVLANDTDPNGDTLTIVPGTLTLPVDGDGTTQGTVTLDNGQVRYVPAPGFAGTVTFDYDVSDGNGGTATGTVTVTVENAAPVADDETAFTTVDTAVTVDVLAGDTDANIPGTTQVLQVTGAIANSGAGVALNNDGTLTVTPAAGFAGDITVTYTVADGAGGTDTGALTVTVDNASPAAAPDGPVPTGTNTPVRIDVLANDTDPNGDTLTLVPGTLTLPVDGDGTTQGTVTLDNGQVRYVPAPGFAGTVTFDYDVSDGNGGTATGTVTVTVENAAPVADDETAFTTTATPVTVDVLTGDTDPNIPGTAQVLQVIGAIANTDATVTVNNDGTLTVTPAAGFAGDVTVTYTVSDGAGGTDTGALTVTVDNAAPVAAADGPVHTSTDTPIRVDVLANDTDPNGDTLTIVPGSLTDPVDADGNTQGTVTLDNGQVRYVPAPGFAGTVTIDYTVSDGNGGTDTGTVTVTVDDAAPVAGDDTVSTPAGTAVDVDVLGNDSDLNGDTLTVSLITQPANGTAVLLLNGQIRYTPNAGFAGTDTFDYTVSDGNGGTDTATVSVAVANADPVAVDDSGATPYGTAVPVSPLDNDTDPNGDTLELVPGSITAPVDAQGTPRGTVSVDGGVVTYTPPAGFSGEVTFTYDVTDGVVTRTGKVTVTVANAAPVAVADGSQVPGDSPSTIVLIGNDTDPDGGTLTVVAITQPDHGTATLVGNDVVYTPQPGYAGTVTFTYTLSDGQGGTTTGTVTLEVLAATTPSAPAPATPPAPAPTAPAPGGASSALPRTGAEPGLLAALAALVTGAGAVLLSVARRRRSGRHL